MSTTMCNGTTLTANANTPLPRREGQGRGSVTLLSTAYFPPVQWFTKLLEGRVLLESCETYSKQTYRNRCVIDSPQGPLALTVPVVHGAAAGRSNVDEAHSPVCGDSVATSATHSETTIASLRLSDHGNWRHQHWQAFVSSYHNTPFFEYYADDFRPFFEPTFDTLFELNEAIVRTCCDLIGIDLDLGRTTRFLPPTPSSSSDPVHDLRDLISPKRPYSLDPHFRPVPYYQVFAGQHGFLPNLSIADLLFNMGPESLLVLQQSRC